MARRPTHVIADVKRATVISWTHGEHIDAIAAGCFPLLPDRLACPELVGGRREFLYDGTPKSLASHISKLAADVNGALSLADNLADLAAQVETWTWPNRARVMDRALELL